MAIPFQLATSNVRPRRKVLGLQRAERRAAWLFLLPFVVGFAVFILFPLLASFILIFMKYDVFSPPKFVGLSNIQAMFADQRFWRAWRVTLVYAVVGVGYSLLLGLIYGMLLFHVRWGRRFWRTLFFLPSLLAGTAEALIQGVVWDPKIGLVNAALNTIGIQGPYWLQDTNWALPALVLIRYWSIGGAILFFMGARTAISRDFYEAASLDGAGLLTTFRKITIPLLSPAILFNLILGIIASLQAFGQIFLLTKGGPAGATEVVGIYLYFQAFRDLQMGYASAVSWSVFVVTITLALAVLFFTRHWIYYESGENDL